MSENIRVYLIDRVGAQANAFADKLAGREGVELVGGAADVDEGLEDITEARPDVVLVGTDVGGAGVVSAVEQVLTVAGDVAVVVLSTRADKALVEAAVRGGAAGSLDRDASDVDTIIALHTYRDRQHGIEVDMKLAEPPAERRNLRVSGALPRFPTPTEDVSYLNETPLARKAEVELEPQPAPPSGDTDPAADALPADGAGDEMQQVREMLLNEGAPVGNARKRKIGWPFGRRPDKKAPWGPRDNKDEETKSS